MLQDRIEAKWIASFVRVFELCQVQASETTVILCETQSRALTIQLAELALQQLGLRPCLLTLPTPLQTAPVPVRSTGASIALQGHPAAMAALTAADFIVDLTLEGLLHAPELATILKSGARVQMISNEHPEALERLERQETSLWVQRALSQLPAKDASVLDQFYLKGLSVDEICQATGLTESNVKTRLLRARRRLREVVEQQFHQQLMN